MNKPIMEFRCGTHTVQMQLTRSGCYSITVTHTGRRLQTGLPLEDQTYSVAEVIDKDLAIHCFNHTVEQYQKEAL